MRHDPADREREVAAIRQLVADAEAYQSDTDRFVDLLTPEYFVVNVVGRRVKGRDEARKAMAAALAGSLSAVLTTHELEDVTFVREDVALASCIKRISDERADATELPSEARLTFTVVKDDGRWRIASAQTTPIAV